MTNPFEKKPTPSPLPPVEAPSLELPKPEPQIPDAPFIPEHPRVSEGLPSSVKEHISIDDLSPEHAEQVADMLNPIKNPALTENLRQEARDRKLQNPDQNGPVVPSTAAEMAEYERRYDTGWQDPAPREGSQEVTEKDKEAVENLRRVVELMDEFELKYPIGELNAITHITLAELVVHPVRKPANIALVHIKKAIDALHSKKMPEIHGRFLSLSQAVGMYNSLTKTVDHDRG